MNTADRIYNAIVQGAYYSSIVHVLTDVQQMTIAQREPVAFVEAVERFERATECGEVFSFH